MIANGLKTKEHHKGAAKIFAKNKKFIEQHYSVAEPQPKTSPLITVI
jgi:hypothetical protein